MRDFLLSNPAFVRDDGELLAAVSTEPSAGNVVAIGDLARDRLLRENRAARSRFSLVVETARANYEAQVRVQEAIISILDAEDPDDLNDRLSGHVAFALAADACVLAVSASHAASEALDRAGAAVERLAPADRPVRLGPAGPDRAWLYGAAAPDMRSEALARLEFGPSRRLALLALASSDPDAFGADHGGELVTFFARVLERVLARFARDGLI